VGSCCSVFGGFVLLSFWWVRAAQFFVYCVEFCLSLFVCYFLFSFSFCIICA
jgi:hypothetical protein